jgi:hypothetical protein
MSDPMTDQPHALPADAALVRQPVKPATADDVLDVARLIEAQLTLGGAILFQEGHGRNLLPKLRALAAVLESVSENDVMLLLGAPLHPGCTPELAERVDRIHWALLGLFRPSSAAARGERGA